MIKRFLREMLRACLRKLTPAPPERDYRAENRVLMNLLAKLTPDESINFYRFREMASEMIEARMMCGSGPTFGAPGPAMLREANAAMLRIEEAALKGLRENTTPVSAVGAFGDIELALANINWRREINMSWLEFSRWGIQQIILISRLYYIKQPLMRRAIDVVAAYVFGRGVEISSTNDTANDVINAFVEANHDVIGPGALLKRQREKSMDGNLFYALFPDANDSGTIKVRMIDATEVQEIITDPDDADKELYFRRIWTKQVFDLATGQRTTEKGDCWYPGIDNDDPAMPDAFNGVPIMKGIPVYHRKHGGITKWRFGCPEGYPAIEWVKTAASYMQSCATLAKSHAQIAWDITTKGGQTAIEGVKQQLQTQVNSQPGSQLWDTNPTPVDASQMVHGPGSEWKMVNSRNQGLDPKEGLTYNIYVGNTFGIPPTWLGDMETSNLSTATTLDRPTELGMRARQTEWEDDLTILAKFALKCSAGAASGKLRESLKPGEKVKVLGWPRKTLPDGRRVYDEAAKPKPDEILVRVTFPAIREGDMPTIIKAIAEAMTLDNKGGQIVGIDEREGVRLLYETLGVEEPEEILDKQYPPKASGVKGTPGYEPAYDPSRTKVPLPPPVQKALPAPGGQPQLPNGQQPQQSTAAPPPPGGVPNPTADQREALAEKLTALVEALRRRRAA